MTFFNSNSEKFYKKAFSPITYHLSPITRSEQTPGYCQSCHDDRYHAHQLDQDVEAGTGGVFERVADRIAYDCRLMGFAALAAVVSFFDMFLGVVPGASRIGHEDRQYEPGAQAADQQSDHSCHSEYQTGEDRCDDG